jgi:hypothetical protein
MTTTVNPAYNTAYQIILDALMNAGKVRTGGSPDPVSMVQYMRRLNKFINHQQTQGLKLFLVEDLAITLVPPISSLVGVPLYTFGPTGTIVMPKPLRVLSGYYLYNTGTQRPLIPMSYPDEYTRLSNVQLPGSISSYAVNKQQATLNVYIWSPPSAFEAANGVLHLLLEQNCQNMVSVTDQMMFPIEWSLALEWGMADQFATGQPAAVQAKCAANAKRYLDELTDWDVEDADTMFQPDQRLGQSYGKFR